MLCHLFVTGSQVDQAALTGESLPVKKFPGHIAFSGSTIKQGEQEALVYATGKNTFFGRAASLIAGTNAVANIQKVTDCVSPPREPAMMTLLHSSLSGGNMPQADLLVQLEHPLLLASRAYHETPRR